jgi:putative flippase GtrA
VKASEDTRTTARRWLKFNFIGLIGIGVQLFALALLKTVLHMNYLLATALAVEAAVVHNFLWHERFTWPDRVAKARLVRFLKFNLTNGAISILGNVLLMRFFAGTVKIPYLAANLITIACCSVFNFLASDRFVFRIIERPGRKHQDQSICPAIWRSTDQMSSGFCSKG